MTARLGAAHHGLPAHEVVLLLGSDPQRGLSDDEAADRLKTFGPNALPAIRGAGLLIRILRQFHHPLIYVLLFAGVITAALGEFIDFAVPVLSAAGKAEVAKLAQRYRGNGNAIEIRSVGLDQATNRFDNWDLAAARLGALARALKAEGVPRDRVVIRGLDQLSESKAGQVFVIRSM